MKSAWMQHPELRQTWQKCACVCTCVGINLYYMVIIQNSNTPNGNLALMKTQPCAAHAFFTLLSCINMFNTFWLAFPKWVWELNLQCFSLQTLSVGFFMLYPMNVSSFLVIPNKQFLFLFSLVWGMRESNFARRWKACAVIIVAVSVFYTRY